MKIVAGNLSVFKRDYTSSQVEEAMIAAVRHTIQKAIKVCVESSRQEWVSKTPGQAVLCAAQVMWAAGITHAIMQGPKALKKYYQDLQVLCFNRNQDQSQLSNISCMLFLEQTA